MQTKKSGKYMFKAISHDVINRFMAHNFLLCDISPSVSYRLMVFVKKVHSYSHKTMVALFYFLSCVNKISMRGFNIL